MFNSVIYTEMVSYSKNTLQNSISLDAMPDNEKLCV